MAKLDPEVREALLARLREHLSEEFDSDDTVLALVRAAVLPVDRCQGVRDRQGSRRGPRHP